MDDKFKKIRVPEILVHLKALNPIPAVHYVREHATCSLEEAADFCNEIGRPVYYRGYKRKKIAKDT